VFHVGTPRSYLDSVCMCMLCVIWFNKVGVINNLEHLFEHFLCVLSVFGCVCLVGVLAGVRLGTPTTPVFNKGKW
jgi:hypothetical protein